jgi:hypothetical protein
MKMRLQVLSVWPAGRVAVRCRRETGRYAAWSKYSSDFDAQDSTRPAMAASVIDEFHSILRNRSSLTLPVM